METLLVLPDCFFPKTLQSSEWLCVSVTRGYESSQIGGLQASQPERLTSGEVNGSTCGQVSGELRWAKSPKGSYGNTAF